MILGGVTVYDVKCMRHPSNYRAAWTVVASIIYLLLLAPGELLATGTERSCWHLPDPSFGTREYCLIVEPKGALIGEEITFTAIVSPPLRTVQYRFRFDGQQGPATINPGFSRVYDKPLSSTVSVAFYDLGQLIIETGSIGFYADAGKPATARTQPAPVSSTANGPHAQSGPVTAETNRQAPSDSTPSTGSGPQAQPGAVPSGINPRTSPDSTPSTGSRTQAQPEAVPPGINPRTPPDSTPSTGSHPRTQPNLTSSTGTGLDAQPDATPRTDDDPRSPSGAEIDPATGQDGVPELPANANFTLESNGVSDAPSAWLLPALVAGLLIVLVLLALWLLRGWYYIRRLLYHRDRKHWAKMYRIIGRMPQSVAKRVLVRQQHAFALNRDGRGAEAEKLLRSLLQSDGPSPETNGILGRVYKDRWELALASGETEQTTEFLNLAITTYIAGHNSDPGNPYPGVNAITLAQFLEQRPPWYDDLQKQLTATVLLYRDISHSYWKYATRLELAVLAEKAQEARAALAKAIDTAPVPWQIETTLNNLRLIRVARSQNDQSPPDWLGEIEIKLETAMTQLAVDY